MIKNLLIVESPTKAKKIQSYLDNTFIVKSSYGHIYDLPKNNLGIDFKNNFYPKYIIPNNKKKIIKELKKNILFIQTVWLATDNDREGEAIAFHLYKELNIFNKKFKRIIFNEITKESINYAINNPVSLNYNLIYAQQTRRILDRLIGFKLSPILWYKLKKIGLSAGRVQSIAVRLIIEREKKINIFQPKNYYKVFANFIYNKNIEFNTNIHQRIYDKNIIKKILNFNIYKIYKINNIINNHIIIKPPLPFITYSLQQEAFKKFNFSILYTMLLAQKLYEEGYITYIRTDNYYFNNNFLNEIKNKIINLYGKEYLNYNFIKKEKGHEAIRPTNINLVFINHNNCNINKLYTLIWERTMSSQMSNAIIEYKNIYIKIFNYTFIKKISKIIFYGFQIINKKNIINNINYSFKIGGLINIKNIYAIQKIENNIIRYNEASLIKELKDLQIGRPSTYAYIINNIQKKYIKKRNINFINYYYKIYLFKNKIIKQKIKNYKFLNEYEFYPTNIGLLVNNFLLKNFSKILDFKFTSKLENDFDAIANGEKIWYNVINNFYINFISQINNIIYKYN